MLATTSGVIKLVGITEWAATKDPTWDLAPLLLWAFTEESLAVWAACIPCLKGPFTRIVQSFTTRPSSFRSASNGHAKDAFASASAVDSGSKSRNMSDADTNIKVSVTVDVAEV